ncbi:uncharacterized protein LOC130998025 [Salvia miltiorrhiza]|uniref:uncharacterized protein LOC130998025 n=1 Tax=Salvia miltiorrhiza TaxID=226208 RepID=UPI0025ACD669|nr:uncharacterized protein LOC130998025 [Salvia miltiorrhiza]
MAELCLAGKAQQRKHAAAPSPPPLLHGRSAAAVQRHGHRLGRREPLELLLLRRESTDLAFSRSSRSELPPPLACTESPPTAAASPRVDGSGVAAGSSGGQWLAGGAPPPAAAVGSKSPAAASPGAAVAIGDNRGSVAVRQPPATTSHRGCPPPDLDSHTQTANTKGFCARIIYCNCSNKSFNSFLVTSVHKYIFSNCKSMNLLLIFFIYQSICKSELMSMCWYSGIDVYN